MLPPEAKGGGPGMCSCTVTSSVADVGASILELDTAADSIGYVTGWSKADTDLIKATADRVLTAANTLAATITENPGDTAAA